MFGGAGNDYIDGGYFDDTINGGSGVDTTSYVFYNRSITADLSTGTVTFPGNGPYTDRLISIENIESGAGRDIIYGNAANNRLVSGAGEDDVYGGGGTDRLTGGLGNDWLFGGIDLVQDIFYFNSTSESRTGDTRDRIYDFASGVDDIFLNLIDANIFSFGNQDFRFSGRTAASHSVWFVDIGTDIVVRGDTNGNTTTDFEIQIMNIDSVLVRDFYL